jgi:antimicrobial peptide system SdpB family protein
VDAFCLVPSSHLEVARWLCVAGLVVIASGWRPRFTGVLHWWIAFSLQASAATIDGGDQIAAILALILIPVTLSDDRRWHWHAREDRVTPLEPYKRSVAVIALTVARFQMAAVYLHAAVGKAYAAQWQDGTALYYWCLSRDFGAPHWLAESLRPFLLNASCVSCMTWGVIMVELALVAGLVAPRRYWRRLLFLGIGLHVGILVVHGLVSFALAMIAGLVLYLRPMGSPFRVNIPEWPRRAKRVSWVTRTAEP